MGKANFSDDCKRDAATQATKALSGDASMGADEARFGPDDRGARYS
jgi:hypothetical protein